MEENGDFDDDQFDRDLRLALTLSMLESHRSGSATQPQDDDAGENKMCTLGCSRQKISRRDSSPECLSDIENPHPVSSPPCIRKIDEILPTLGLDVNLNKISSSESRGMSPDMRQEVPASCFLKRGRSYEDDVMVVPKRLKIGASRRCSANSTSSHTSGSSRGDTKRTKWDLQEEIGRGLHITRRQSRELSRILYRTPRDKESIRHKLDPSIFDAEVSDNDSDIELDLLPEQKEEIESILVPQCLDITYNEKMEFRYNDNSDDLPDLDLDHDVLDEEVRTTSSRSVHHTVRHREVRDIHVTPVLDKLQMTPVVKLTKIDSPLKLSPQKITKRLKLKSVSDSESEGKIDAEPLPSTSTGSPLINFQWSQKHNTLLRSIVSSVGHQLSLTKEPTSQLDSDDDDSGSADGDVVVPFEDYSLDYDSDQSMNVPEVDTVCESSFQAEGDLVHVAHKTWRTDADSDSDSDSEMDSDEEEWQVKKHQEAAAMHHGHGRVVCITKPANKSTETSQPLLLTHSQLGMHHPILPPLATQTTTKDAKKIHPLDSHMADIIENSDIDDEKFQLRYLKMCRSFIVFQGVECPLRITKQLVELMLNGASPLVSWGAYDILNSVLSTNVPLTLAFDWPRLEEVVDRLKLSYGISNCDPSEILSPALTLQYMISALEAEVQYSTSVSSDKAPQLSHRHFTKCKAFAWLSLERGFSRMKQVISWLASSISYGQHVPISLNKPSINFTPSHLTSPSNRPKQDHDSSQVTVSKVPKLMPLFQRLMNLGVVVSRQRYENTERIVTDLLHYYVHMPLYYHRHLLISNIQSPLITFNLAQQVLEEYGSTTSSYSLGVFYSLHDILQCYSLFQPPTMTLTPPLTPTDQGDVNSDEGEVKKKFSPASVEELAFLMWSIVSNYMKISESEKDRETLKNISPYIHTLEAWYKSLTKELTPKTQLYLQMLDSLAGFNLTS